MTTTAVFEIKTEKYNGPFDLILLAIKEERLGIFEVSISEITSAYFNYLQRLETIDLSEASDFMLMAALLLEMKSKRLLPQPEEIELKIEEDEVQEDLLRHIQEYKLFKMAAQTLKGHKEAFKRVYSRYHREVLGPVQKDFYLKDVNLQDLVLAFKRVWDSIGEEKEEVRQIKDEEITLPKRVEEVIGMLEGSPDGVEFEKLFIRHTRLEVVVTFLAILELAKHQRIKILQGVRFGGIRIVGN